MARSLLRSADDVRQRKPRAIGFGFDVDNIVMSPNESKADVVTRAFAPYVAGRQELHKVQSEVADLLFGGMRRGFPAQAHEEWRFAQADDAVVMLLVVVPHCPGPDVGALDRQDTFNEPNL
jgi:hypothetical protein